MRNSILVTSDLQSVILVDSKREDQRLAIGKRGVLLSVLGNDICASEVPAELDTYVTGLLAGKTAFYSFEMKDAAKNQLCITYNDVNNVVFIIGITDITVGFTVPTEIDRSKVTTFAIKLKNSPTTGLGANATILARLETTGAGANTKRFVKFYHLTNA